MHQTVSLRTLLPRGTIRQHRRCFQFLHKRFIFLQFYSQSSSHHPPVRGEKLFCSLQLPSTAFVLQNTQHVHSHTHTHAHTNTHKMAQYANAVWRKTFVSTQVGIQRVHVSTPYTPHTVRGGILFWREMLTAFDMFVDCFCHVTFCSAFCSQCSHKRNCVKYLHHVQ